MDPWDMSAAAWSHILAETGVVCADYTQQRLQQAVFNPVLRL